MVLVILDGFGVNPSKINNAVAEASTPRLDEYFYRYPWTLLDASGAVVATTTTDANGGGRPFADAVEGEDRGLLKWRREEGAGGVRFVMLREDVAALVLVLQAGIELARRGGRAVLSAAAGEQWDEVVARAVAEKLAGIEVNPSSRQRATVSSSTLIPTISQWLEQPLHSNARVL